MAAAPALPTPIQMHRNMPLWEIVDTLDTWYETLEGVEDPQDRADIEQWIREFEELEVRKVDGIAGYLSRLTLEQSYCDDEIKRLQARKKSWQTREARIEATVERVMTQLGKDKLEGRTNTLELRDCPASVEVLDETQVPDDYKRIKIEESVDKVSAKKALQAGIEIPGLKLVTDKKSVRVR